MADAGPKANYLVEYQFAYLGGDPHEFRVEEVALHDALNECYSVRLRCQIPAAQDEPGQGACTGRRLKDVELLIRRRFPDGFVLETRVLGVLLALERTTAKESDDTFNVNIVPAMALLAHHTEGGTWHNRSYADVLREVTGLNYEQIAQREGCPKGTVMSRLFHARRQLRAVLGRKLDLSFASVA